eukprot:CAMPEP_0182858844 /NCGR_PEP_ID=MMETSP0034_2-20130328/3924_1 /TAXON_ID=156128 /ORGANISM="Nephroselmis pyriformis, Strain CCMP717" /LENGTH=220 /DNA_ID=CAMNT_0024990333 /DNA_START=36 /DNA_END=699 /DNA_ORIENTATION=+
MILDATRLRDVVPASWAWGSSAPEGARLRMVWMTREGYSRNMQDEGAVLERLRELECIDLRIVNFAQMHAIEQFRTMRECDIVSGLHGAAFGNTIMLPTTGSVLEIHPGIVRSESYNSMANWRKLDYEKVMVPKMGGQVQGRVVADILLPKVRRACAAVRGRLEARLGALAGGMSPSRGGGGRAEDAARISILSEKTAKTPVKMRFGELLPPPPEARGGG